MDKQALNILSLLLEKDAAVPSTAIASRHGISSRATNKALAELAREKLIVQGRHFMDKSGEGYWRPTGKAHEIDLAAESTRIELAGIMNPFEKRHGQKNPGLDSDAARAFHEFVIRRYRPPANKRYLIFFQCSIGRPFWRSPSHGTIRRAIKTATGADAAQQFHSCPAHVVVLASTIGPVPYDLQEIFPANISAGGVKHFGHEHYARVRPVLAQRMADYLSAHGSHYEHTASFADGRYGEILLEAGRLAGTKFPIYPRQRGARIVSIKGSPPRTYWQRYWIQLHLEIVSWLDCRVRKEAEERLRKAGVEWARQ